MSSTSAVVHARGALPPIAIVGIGCRFPGGANTPEEFWTLLRDGVDAVGEIMPGRWDAGRWYHADPSCPGRVYTRAAGCLAEIDRFDAEFFGISPREAATMDPQQRLLLEVAWETLEDAGVIPGNLAGTPTGVFVGICAQEYATLQERDPLAIAGTTNTGGALSIAANRISYHFDLRGPSFAVDTACSSSLVALDSGCKSIWRGETSMALVGGVSLLLKPEMSVGFGKARMLSPTGRCRPFDAAADGYVRGEGAGMVLLKPLKQAMAENDRIYAVIAATGVNHDGRTSGLTVPNGKAQEALVREVLSTGGVRPEQVQFVEAHGTGTPVGDPIECLALGEVLGRNRTPESFCRIGSVKSNIGHLEGASGIAGLIKVALALHYRMLPPNLHFGSPNPNIPLEELRLQVQQRLEPWPAGVAARTAGVNSFGFGGTNAHVVLKEHVAPDVEPRGDATSQERAEILIVSASSADSRGLLARRYQQTLDEDEHELRDVCHAAAAHRATHPYRLAIVGSSNEDLSEGIGALLSGERHPRVFTSQRAATRAPRIGFAFSGNGPQWWGMARQLLADERVFRETVLRCDVELRRYDNWSLLEELGRDEASSRMHLTEIAQPALFAIQMALAKLLATWGIEPEIVFGHSVGEVAAAAVAGVLDFDGAVRVVYHRSRTQAKTAGLGGMAAVNLPAAEARRLIDRYDGKLTIAAENARDAVTVSGNSDALDDLLAHLERNDVYSQKLRLGYAFHSHHMEPLRDDLLESLAGVAMRDPSVRFVSTVTGEEVTDGRLSAGYWWENMRRPVRFADACELVAHEGFDAIVEIGPHPVVAGYVAEAFAAEGKSGKILPSLRRYADDRAMLLSTVGLLFAIGQPVRFSSIYPGRRSWVWLPKYAWNRDRYWNVVGEPREVHPLLGVSTDGAKRTWQQHVSTMHAAYLADHRFEGTVVFPAAGYVEMALAAGREAFGTDRIDVDQLDIHRALTLPDDATCAVQFQLGSDGTFQVSGRPRRAEAAWVRHASGKIRVLEGAEPSPVDVEEMIRSFERTRPSSDVYQQAAAGGLDYGPSFRRIEWIRSSGSEALAEVRAADGEGADGPSYQMHPTVLDACFQAVLGLVQEDPGAEPSGWLPVRIGRFRLFRQCEARAYCHVLGVRRSERFLAVDARVFDPSGRPIAWIDRLCFQEVKLGHASDEPLQYVLQWEEDADASDCADSVDSTEADQPLQGDWLVFGDRLGVAQRLALALRSEDADVQIVVPGQTFDCAGPGQYAVNPCRSEDFVTLLETMRLKSDRLAGIVYLWGLDVSPDEGTDSYGDSYHHSVDVCAGVVHLVQALDATGQTCGRLWLVSGQTGEAEQDDASCGVFQAPLWGLGRVVRNERPGLKCTLVGLASEPDEMSADLLDELHRGDNEAEILRRDGQRRVRRLRPLTEPSLPVSREEDCQYRLELDRVGQLDRFGYRRMTRSQPGPRQVEIEVVAAGLNFKDVMWATGMLPGEVMADSFAGACLGFECAGVVSAVGAEVTDPRLGDEVMAFAPHAFGRYATTMAEAVCRKPAGMKFSAAATIPVAFLTAEYALSHLARVRPGERVLIHGGAGGVGMAAIQIVRDLGGVVLATAGSQQKREYLASLGVEHVLDSRSLAFGDGVLAATDGEGVDVVLNSLAGDAMERSLSLLRPFGRFLEIGKRDFVENNRLRLRPMQNNVSYFAIDVDQLLKYQPNVARAVLQEVLAKLHDGRYHALPNVVFPASEVADAFRHMQRSQHIGKVVVSMSDADVAIRPSRCEPIRFKQEGSYLIVGGRGGIGLALARWFAENGAGHLILAGRSPTDDAAAEIESLRAAGASVHLVQVDVNDRQALASRLDEVRATMPPLRGLVHAAMVLDDATIGNLDRQRLEKVMACKTLGAWNLHCLTRDDPLDHFVMFSSLSSVLGNPGQANYAAANAFLDELASARKCSGLPALAVDWGLFGEVGYAAKQQDLVERFARIGVRAIAPQQAFRILGKLMAEGLHGPVVVANLQWGRWRRVVRDSVSPTWGHLAVQGTGDPESAEDSFHDVLALTAPEDWPELFERRVAGHVAFVLGTTEDRLDMERPVTDLGLDSLMAVELRHRIESDMGVELSMMKVAAGETIASLARWVAGSFEPESTSGSFRLDQPAASGSQGGVPPPARSAVEEDATSPAR